jgi:hypothetical protein
VVPITRRGFCGAGLSSLFGALLGDSACAITLDWEPSKQFEMLSQSGNPELDAGIIILLKRIIDILGINPGFKFIKEHNALALADSVVPGTNGTVLLGIPLIETLMRQGPDVGASIAVVCAHECAHIYQMNNPKLWERLKEKGTKTIELHADFIAGYCLNRLNLPARSVATISLLGLDVAEGHGVAASTPQMRALAFYKGFELAKGGASISAAAEAGYSFVTSS